MVKVVAVLSLFLDAELYKVSCVGFWNNAIKTLMPHLRKMHHTL